MSEHKALAELADGRPLLMGALNHVVLVGPTYEKSARGKVRIVDTTVIDPQPGKRIPSLLAGEMKQTYVSAVEVMGGGAEGGGRRGCSRQGRSA